MNQPDHLSTDSLQRNAELIASQRSCIDELDDRLAIRNAELSTCRRALSDLLTSLRAQGISLDTLPNETRKLLALVQVLPESKGRHTPLASAAFMLTHGHQRKALAAQGDLR